MRFLAWILGFCIPAAVWAADVTVGDSGKGADRRITIENGYFKAVVNPGAGARVESLVHKRSGKDVTLPLTETRPGGLLSDHLWQQDYWTGDWLRSAYDVKILEQTPKQVRIQFSSVGTTWKGITISKIVTVRSDSAALHAAYSLGAANEVDPRAKPQFHFHQTLAGAGKVFMPSEAGVVARPVSTETESWVYDPSRPWLAYIGEAGTGLAASFDYSRIRSYRTSKGPNGDATTMEWILRIAQPAPGEKIDTPVVLAPFTGLKEVTAAGAKLALDMQLDASGAKITIAGFEDGKAKLTLYRRNLADNKREPIGEKDLALKADGLTEVSIPIPAGKASSAVGGVIQSDGMPDVTFEKPIFVPGSPGIFAMLPESNRVPEVSDAPSWQRYHPKKLQFDSTAIESPHRVWAKPYAGGRPRVLVLLPEHTERQAIEMAQRFDMEVTCPFLIKDTYYVVGDRVRSLKLDESQAQVDEIVARDYDAIVLNPSDTWTLLTPKSRETVIKKIEAGTGVILLQRGDVPDEFKQAVPMQHLGYDWTSGLWEQLPHTPPIISGLPYAAMPPSLHSNGTKMRPGADELDAAGTILLQAVRPNAPPGAMVVIGQMGKGRLVQSFTEGYMIPVEGKFVGREPDNGPLPPSDYWEYHYAMMARLIYWAAKMESPVTLTKVDAKHDKVEISLHSQKASKGDVTVVIRDYFGNVLREIDRPCPIAAKGETKLVAPIPADVKTRGHIADVIVKGEKGIVLAFGAGAFPPATSRFTSVAPEKKIYLPTESAVIVAKLTGDIPASAVVRGAVYDGSGRRVAEAESPASAETKVALPLNRVIGPMYQVRTELTTRDRVLDQGFCEGQVKATRRPEKYQTAFWGGVGGGNPENVILSTYQFFKDMGITANWATEGPQSYDARFLRRLNMPYSRSAAGMAATGGVGKKAAAEQPEFQGCMHDPAALADKLKGGQKAGEAHWAEDIIVYSCGDENRGPVKDICFCPISNQKFREWLQATQFKSLDAMNKEWGTTFASWDQVIAMEEQEAKDHLAGAGKSCGAWLDQRNFNKWSYSELAKPIVQGVHQYDPGATVGDSGTQESAVYGGRDYWFHSRAFTGMAAYGGTQSVEQECYSPNLIRYSWAGYSKPAPMNRVQFYGRLSTYDRGIAVFASRSHINPDFTMSEAGKDVRAVFLELQRGIGQMFVSSQVAADPVYILQSVSSIAGAYITGNDGAATNSRNRSIALLEELGIRHRAISYEQLATGFLPKTGAKVLILPWSIALSPEEVAAIEKFVDSGGTLIADMQTGLMSAHGRMLPQPSLDNVFGIDRSRITLIKGEKEKTLQASPQEPGKLTIETALAESGIEEKGAEAIWKVSQPAGSDVPVVFMNHFGKGRAYYFAFDLYGAESTPAGTPTAADSPAKVVMVQKIFDKALADAGVRPHATVHLRDPKTGALGERAPWIWTKMKTSGNTRYIILMRDYTAAMAPLEDAGATVKLRDPGVIYDVVSGRYIGTGDAIDITLTNSTGRAFAVLPAPVQDLKVTPAKQAARGEDFVLDCETVVLGGKSDPRVLRVDVTRPDGSVQKTYSADVILKESGKGQVRIPFALNDPAGTWRIRVTDVPTGTARVIDAKLE